MVNDWSEAMLKHLEPEKNTEKTKTKKAWSLILDRDAVLLLTSLSYH